MVFLHKALAEGGSYVLVAPERWQLPATRCGPGWVLLLVLLTSVMLGGWKVEPNIYEPCSLGMSKGHREMNSVCGAKSRLSPFEKTMFL